MMLNSKIIFQPPRSLIYEIAGEELSRELLSDLQQPFILLNDGRLAPRNCIKRAGEILKDRKADEKCMAQEAEGN